VKQLAQLALKLSTIGFSPQTSRLRLHYDYVHFKSADDSRTLDVFMNHQGYAFVLKSSASHVMKHLQFDLNEDTLLEQVIQSLKPNKP
jgi:hypothetical protein